MDMSYAKGKPYVPPRQARFAEEIVYTSTREAGMPFPNPQAMYASAVMDFL